MAFFGGIGGAASRGILFKGGGCFEQVANADTVALDKTGTLTSGSFRVSEALAFGIDREELFYLAASAEYISNHPLSNAIRGLSDRAVPPTKGEEIAGEGVIATIDSRTVAVGNSALMQRVGASVPTPKGGEVFVAVDGVLSGIITLSDEVKPEAKAALKALSSLGVCRSVMLSGDRRENAEAVARELRLSAVYSELSPEDKYSRLEELISKSNGGVYYVGDGINDAPSLARADVGIAMGNVGQDSAIESADLVIMSDNLMRIPEARIIAGKTISIAKQNIVFALAVKLIVMILGALGLANMWLAVFADVGVAVLAILNSMRTLLIAQNTSKLIEKANKT
jgi:Cd2+/Zn2+-exporting ATPase